MPCSTAVTCERCGDKMRVLDTRARADGSIKRRRECPTCGFRRSTLEVAAEDSSPPAEDEDGSSVHGE